MLSVSRMCRWVPKYFANIPKRPRGKRPHRSDVEKRPLHSEGKPSSLVEASGVFTQTNAYLSQLHTVYSTPTECAIGDAPFSRREWNRLCEEAQEHILRPLRSLLPPPPSPAPLSDPPHSAAQTEAPEQKVDPSLDGRWKVVADEDLLAFESRRHPVNAEREGPAAPSPCPDEPITAPQREGFLPSAFTRVSLAPVLALYYHVESTDGLLLKQLFEELMAAVWREVDPVSSAPVRRGVTCSARPGEPRYGTVAQLLFLLSELKVVNEELLQALIRPQKKKRESSRTRQPEVGGEIQKDDVHDGVLYGELGSYQFSDCLLLGPALHRFGLHEHAAFHKAVQQLRQLRYRPGSSLGIFCQHMALRRKQTEQRSHHESLVNYERKLVEMVQQAAVSSSVLPMGVRLSPALVPLLVEWIDAIALSPFRDAHVLEAVADILAVTAIRCWSAWSPSPNQATPRSEVSCWPAVPPVPLSREKESCDVHADRPVLTPHRLTQLLWTAVRRAEQIELPQPTLAAVLQHTLSLSGKGLVLDGGEDLDRDPSRLAFYDHVTADLIKVRAVK